MYLEREDTHTERRETWLETDGFREKREMSLEKVGMKIEKRLR